MMKRWLMFICGAALSTGAVWGFTYVTRCAPVFIGALICPEQPYIIPWTCTFMWPFVIGLMMAFNAVFEEVMKTDDEQKGQSK